MFLNQKTDMSGKKYHCNGNLISELLTVAGIVFALVTYFWILCKFYSFIVSYDCLYFGLERWNISFKINKYVYTIIVRRYNY